MESSSFEKRLVKKLWGAFPYDTPSELVDRLNRMISREESCDLHLKSGPNTLRDRKWIDSLYADTKPRPMSSCKAGQVKIINDNLKEYCNGKDYYLYNGIPYAIDFVVGEKVKLLKSVDTGNQFWKVNFLIPENKGKHTFSLVSPMIHQSVNLIIPENKGKHEIILYEGCLNDFVDHNPKNPNRCQLIPKLTEELKPGDWVYVTDKLREHIKKEIRDNRLLGYIGHRYQLLTRIGHSNDYGFYWNFEGIQNQNLRIPESCLHKVEN